MEHLRKILAAVELDRSGPLVIGEAISIARASGGEVHVLHVEDAEATTGHAEAQLQSMLEGFRGLGVPIHEQVEVGDAPSEIIAERSRGYDLVVLAKKIGSRFFHDAVAEKVVEQTSARVLVIHDE